MKCKSCGAGLDLTLSTCPACGAEVELGRLTGILGLVCRACDAYNDPGAKTCAACGKPLGAEPPAPPPSPAQSPALASPMQQAQTPPSSAAPPSPQPESSISPPPSGPRPSPDARPPVNAATAPPAAPELPAAKPPPAGAPVLRSFSKPSPGAATRFVPSVLHPSAQAKNAPSDKPIPLVTTCPRCGADAQGRFCASCGQALGTRGTQVMMKPSPPGRTATGAFGELAAGRAQLVLDAGGGLEGATFRLNAETVEAGRSKGAIVFPDDPCLAAHHATFFYRSGALHVRDEAAPGGVFLRLRGLSVPIRPGDHFAMGDRLLRYAGPLAPSPTPPPDGTRRLGAPRPPSPAVVVEECLEGAASGRVFVRGGPSVTIGRAGCSIGFGDDPHLSQAHAEISIDAVGNARLRDLGSSNGTYVKIPRNSERELRDGDCIRMGREVLRVAVAT